MKICEIILNEDHYAAGDNLDLDALYNPEIAAARKNEDDRYKKYDSHGSTPVVKEIDYNQEDYDSDPQKGQRQSPGYRGREYSKARAGMPYNKHTQPSKHGFDRVIDPELGVTSSNEPTNHKI